MPSKPRSRPSKLSDQTTRYIARLARKDDRPSWAAIAAAVDGGLSRSTVRRVARVHAKNRAQTQSTGSNILTAEKSSKAALGEKRSETAD